MRDSVAAILNDGGWVLYALVIVCFLMWWVAALRFNVVRRRSQVADLDAALRADALASDANEAESGDIVGRFAKLANDAACQGDVRLWTKVDAHSADARKRLGAWRALLKSMVAAAPMLGLLGTVGGMVETFATLHVSGLAHADESVAGGISTALLTTQLGLLVGVPGLIAAKTLDRLETRRVQELTEVRQLIAFRLLSSSGAK